MSGFRFSVWSCICLFPPHPYIYAPYVVVTNNCSCPYTGHTSTSHIHTTPARTYKHIKKIKRPRCLLACLRLLFCCSCRDCVDATTPKTTAPQIITISGAQQALLVLKCRALRRQEVRESFLAKLATQRNHTQNAAVVCQYT